MLDSAIERHSVTSMPSMEEKGGGVLHPRNDQAKVRDMKSARLETQLENLCDEKLREQEQLKDYQSMLSESLRLEHKAKVRAEKGQREYDYHTRQMILKEKQIKGLREELGAYAVPTTSSLRPGSTDSNSSPSLIDGFPAFMYSGSTGTGGSRGGSRLTSSQMSRQSTRQSQDIFRSASDSVLREEDRFGTDSLEVLLNRGQSASSSNRPGRKKVGLTEDGANDALLDLPTAELHDLWRCRIREEMVKLAGGAKKAFNKIDLNGSGHISRQEFADGVTRIGVDWRGITGFKWERDLFVMFDLDKDGVLDFKELFPIEANREAEPKRATTPEFWKVWCERTTQDNFVKRPPHWEPTNPAEELEFLFKSQQQLEEGAEQKRWISSAFRRLKMKGKSDARSRETVVKHLPRGTGPRDRDGCHTFSESNVKFCRKQYADQSLEPTKNIQKVIYDMRDSKRLLQGFRQQLSMVTNYRKQELEEQRPAAAAGLKGLLGKGSAPEAMLEATQEGGMNTMATIGRNAGIDEDKLNEWLRLFEKLQDASTKLLTKKNFVKMLEGVFPNRTFADSETEAWWTAARNTSHSGDPSSDAPERARIDSKARKNQINFEQFVVWYSDSEFRKELGV